MTRVSRGLLVAAALAAFVMATPAAAQMTIADCTKKDGAMFKRHEAKFAELAKKTRAVNLEALAKQPDKYCTWLKEFALPNHDQWRQELETRLTGECRREPFVWARFADAYHAVMITKRQIDSVCSGVEAY